MTNNFQLQMAEQKDEEQHFSAIAKGQYELVDPSRITVQSKRPHISIQIALSSTPHLHHPLNSTPIQALQRLPDQEQVELPLSYQKEKSFSIQQQKNVEPQMYNSVPEPSQKRNFAKNNRKEIEDVIYDEIRVTRSQIKGKKNDSPDDSRGIFRSRFVSDDRSRANQVQTDRSPLFIQQERQKISPNRSTIHISNPIVSSLPILRKSLSPVERQKQLEGQTRFPNAHSPAKDFSKISSQLKNQPQRQQQLKHNIYFPVPFQKSNHTPDKMKDPFEGGDAPALAQRQLGQNQLIEQHSSPKREEGYLSQRLRQQRKPQLFKNKSRHNGIEDRWEEDMWVTSTEPRVKYINQSPSRHTQRYLRSEEKHDFRIFRLQEPSEDYIQEGRLKQQFLKAMEDRRVKISQELVKLGAVLTTPQKVKSQQDDGSRSRKKIFDRNQMSDPRSQLKKVEEAFQKPGLMTPGPKDVRSNSTAGRILRVLNQKRQLSSEIKRQSGHKHIDFDSLKGKLIGDRVKIFKSKQQQKQNNRQPFPDNEKPHLLFSSRKFRISELSPQTRQWYEHNRRQILYQTQKISSYELLRRYMSEKEIENRLQQMLLGRVEPRRWCLTMVDEVYSRLKDRYLAVSF